MSFRHTAIAAAALSLAALAPAGFARAADMPVKAVKPIVDVPFFFVIDDRVTFSYIPTAAQPACYGQSERHNQLQDREAGLFVHPLRRMAYGTNFFTISLFKSDHNDPAAPCINAGISTTFAPAAARCERNLRPVPLDLRFQPDLQHQGLQHRAAARRVV